MSFDLSGEESERLRKYCDHRCPAGFAMRSTLEVVGTLPEQLRGWVRGTPRHRFDALYLAQFLVDVECERVLVGEPAEFVIQALARQNLLDAFVAARSATVNKPAHWALSARDDRLTWSVTNGLFKLKQFEPAISAAAASQAADEACGSI